MDNTTNYTGISDEDIKRCEEVFVRRMKAQGVIWGTRTMRNYEAEFFCGCMIMANIANSRWSISIMSGRPIVEPYKLE